MRLVEEVVEILPGRSARTRRVAKRDDWYFQGHFPDQPVVPAIILIELLAQTGGLAACSDGTPTTGRPRRLRLAAIGVTKFPAAAGVGSTLEAIARVAGRFGGMIRIEGNVQADGRLVAVGSLTLAEVQH
jgi:3-hydroxyacyl-[acyl-carrier-protein] dehydratase